MSGDPLGAARASHQRGRERLSTGDAEGALAAAQGGLDELGDDYAGPAAIDDTGMKLLAAVDMAENGNSEGAARATLRVLENRIEMYAETHGESGTAGT